jgi:DNA-binding NtrC family response regulator
MSDHRTRTIGETPSSTPDAVVIEATDGPGRGVRAVLRAGTFFVGSDPKCDLVLADDTVSRRHASLELLKGQVAVTDLGSRNGTHYLGARVTTARVAIGGSIRVGKTVLALRPEATSQAALSEAVELHGLVGQSVAMRAVFSLLERLGPTEGTVLLQGETGVGKGTAARALHALSPRARGPFVVFDCAAANPNLLESSLFGHVKGAFTGADRDRLGAVDSARGGTLFLDEVGELSPELQPRLLRLLEQREFTPVGSNKPKRADVRVLAATHRDLKSDIVKGRFRKDLFFRLAVTEVVLPPLRERLEDIAVLARRFAKESSGVEVPIQPATLAAFQCMQWPGNVRELRNAIERVLSLGTIETAAPTTEEPSFIEARDRALERFEHDYLVALLEQHKGAAQAARAAKLARSHFYRLLERHGLNRRD